MSRFYNALKEASRSQPPGETVWEGLKPRETPPAPQAEMILETAPPAARMEPESPLLSLEEEFHELNSAPASHSGFFGSHADVSLDQSARLIPHAVDRAVVEHYRKLRTKIMQQH